MTNTPPLATPADIRDAVEQLCVCPSCRGTIDRLLAFADTMERIAQDTALQRAIQMWCHTPGHLRYMCAADVDGLITALTTLLPDLTPR